MYAEGTLRHRQSRHRQGEVMRSRNGWTLRIGRWTLNLRVVRARAR